MVRVDGKLIILSGPSCVGKSPLFKALAKFYPDLSASLQPLVLYNSREPRPGETDDVDYHFRDRSMIESLRERSDHVVLEVRGDLQALDIGELRGQLAGGPVLFEGNPFVGRILIEHPQLCEVRKTSAFMAPVCRVEMEYVLRADVAVDASEFVTEMMRRKLTRRMRRQKKSLGALEHDEIERRARSAFGELRLAGLFDVVIPNHDGEDSENWLDLGMPIGDARRALDAFAALLRGESSELFESWAGLEF